MPRKTNKLKNLKKGTKKQKTYLMIGCSKKGNKTCLNKKKVFSSLKNKSCPNCGPNCHCGPNCKCPHPCPGNCYLNRCNKKQHGGYNGCGSCGCPLSPMSWNQMNKFGGKISSYPEVLNQPVINNYAKDGFNSILGIGQNGGNCSACGQIPVVSSLSGGGNFYKQIGPMPGPEVGNAWGANLKWPGINGVGGDRNFLNSYNTNNDPTTQQLPADANSGYPNKMSLVGGYRYNKKNTSKKGGGLVPQDLVNLGRDFSYNFKTAYNAINGYKAPVDPAPYKGQLTGTLNNNSFMQ